MNNNYCFDPYSYQNFELLKIVSSEPDRILEVKKNKLELEIKQECRSKIFFKSSRNKYLLAIVLDYLNPNEQIDYMRINSLTIKALGICVGEDLLKSLKEESVFMFKKTRLNDLLNEDANPLMHPLKQKLFKDIHPKFEEICINFIGKWLNKFYLEKKDSTTTEINLNSHKIGDIGAKILGRILIRNKSLISLNVPNNLIHNEGMKYLIIGLTHLEQLEELNLSSNKLNQENLNILTNYLKRKKNLRFLNLAYVSLYDKGLKLLSKHLHYLQNLETLYLDGNSIYSKESMLNLVDALVQIPTIFHVSLSNNELSNCWDELLILIEKTPIINLNLRMNKLKNIHRKIQKSNIKYLNLSNNRIGISGFKYIFASLRKLMNLSEIYIMDNPLEEELVYKYIVKALIGLEPKNLIHFYVGPFKFNKELKENIKNLSNNIVFSL